MMFDSFILRVLLLLGLMLATHPGASCSAEDSESARNRDVRWRLDTQQQIREQSRTMLMHIVDLQLQNLEENNLQELPLYREIRSMRSNVGGLIDGEMQSVVDLLEEVHGTPDEGSPQTHARIRETAREIVSRLTLERQRIARRLKSAELRKGVERLIDAQDQTSRQTTALSEVPPDRQEAELHAALEGQRDVRQRFLNLESALRDASQWRGEEGASAASALRELEQSHADQEFNQAIAALENLQPGRADAHQQRLLHSFRKIADRLDPAHTETSARATRTKPGETVQRLRDAQSAIRDKTRDLVPDSPEADELVASQTGIRRELGELATQVADQSEARSALEEAQAAAESSRRYMFEGDRDQALEDQERVLGALERAGNQMENSENVSPSAQSAQQANASVRQLEDVARQTTEIARRQSLASGQMNSDPDSASRAESQIAADLQETASQKDLLSKVSDRLTDAREAATAAAKALEDPKDPDRDRRAVDKADRAIERAAAEAQAALNDAKRRALAVKAGELSRAAEALDRASAAQRDVADALRQAERSGDLSAETARGLAEREREIKAVSEKIGAGVANAASAATDQARESHEAVNEAERAMSSMATAGAPEEPAIQNARERADNAAHRLSQTAEALRQEVESLAESLAGEASRQATELATAREAVESELENAPAAAADQVEKAGSARRKLHEAQAEQMRAAGRPRAARMQELRESIQEALDRQTAASAAAERAQSGRATMGEALESQQSATKQTAGLAPQVRAADESLGEAARALDQATRAGERAARAMLDGNNASASRDRKAAEEALLQALASTDTQSAAAAESPRGKRDAAAQGRVRDAIAEARKLTETENREIVEPLAEAEKASKEAEERVREEDPESAEKAQQETEESLAEADARIQEFLAEAASEVPQQLADDGRRAEKLAPQAASDPEALSALREAERAALDAPTEPQEQSASQLQARALMQQAAQSLATREQSIRRDEAAAKSMAETAARQREAAQEIIERRAELNQDPADKPDPERQDDAPPPPEEDQAAIAEAGRRLNAASEEFAQAQRGTGQRAEEIAGQSQIGNSPLQEALEMASRLGEGTMAGTGARGQSPGQESASGSTEGSGGAPGKGGSMGTGFVPDSPEATARMLAGANALKKAAAAGAGGASSEDGGDASKEGPKSGRPGSGSGSSSDSDEQGPQADGPGNSTGRGAGSAQSASAPGSREGDIDPSSIPAAREEPWLLKLPPETRQAIRARAQRPPPRSYEQRLKRYFESVR